MSRCDIGHCCLNGICKPLPQTFVQTDFQWQLCRSYVVVISPSNSGEPQVIPIIMHLSGQIIIFHLDFPRGLPFLGYLLGLQVLFSVANLTRLIYVVLEANLPLGSKKLLPNPNLQPNPQTKASWVLQSRIPPSAHSAAPFLSKLPGTSTAMVYCERSGTS